MTGIKVGGGKRQDFEGETFGFDHYKTGWIMIAKSALPLEGEERAESMSRTEKSQDMSHELHISRK